MLEIYFDGSFLEFDDIALENMFVDEGTEWIVYKYKNDAIKIYKTCGIIDYEQCKKLMSISTERILLPRKIVYGRDMSFFGYSTSFISKEPVVKIMDMKIEDFVLEIDILREDLKKLANNGIEIEKWLSCNVLYNGKIYIENPGRFIFRNTQNMYNTLDINECMLNNFLKCDLFSLANLSCRERNNINTVFNNFESYSAQISDTMQSGETVKKYIKRMAR